MTALAGTRMVGLDAPALRRVNTSVVLRALAAYPEAVTMTEIADDAGLSRRTVGLILEDLVGAGWVLEHERIPVRSDAGRPPRRFELRADHALLVGVRITTRSASAVIADVRGRIVGRAERLLARYLDPADSIDTAVEVVFAALDDAGATVDRLRAGGIASGGAVDDEGVIRRLVHAEPWVGVDLPAEFGRRLPIPWVADNDANLGALAEHWRGAARDHRDVVWAILGNRSGLGLLIRGTVHRGHAGAAGEIVEANSLPAASRQDDLLGGLSSPLPEARAAALRRLEEVRAGDPAARAELDEFVEVVSDIVTTLAWTVAPSLIVLAGGLEDGADLLVPALSDSLTRRRTLDVEVRASTLGADGPLLGTLKFVLDRMDTALFGPIAPAR